jgi:hypothetical protein
MQVEIYPDLAAFCGRADYQQWLSQWQPPAGVELWLDHEQQLVSPGDPMTPRQQELTRRATRLPFHLLESLEIRDLACVDIGCGHNWFRHHHPRMWGVDPDHEQHRDEELTPAWWWQNRHRWPRALAINSLHFCPQQEVTGQVSLVLSLLEPGGRAFVALNRARIEERTPRYDESPLRQQLSQSAGVTRMVWVDSPRDAFMDGNLWLWLERPDLVA